jgi:hypothetical protein
MTDGSRVWAVKGVSDHTRDAAREAAQAAGLAIGDWIDRALAKAAEEARHPKPPAATRAEVAKVVREALSEQLAPMAERIDRLAERLASLEEAVGRPTRPEPEPEPAGDVVGAPAPAPTSVEAVRTRLRRRRGL